MRRSGLRQRRQLSSTSTLNPLSISGGVLWLDPYDSNAVATTAASILDGNDFSSANWGKFNATVTANNATAPDGTLTADTMVAVAGVSKYIYQAVSNGQFSATMVPIRRTLYAKYVDVQWVRMFDDNVTPAIGSIFFDIQNGVVGSVGSHFSAASITSVGNGWWKCEWTQSTGTSTPYVGMHLSTTDTTATDPANGTSMQFWNHTIEQVRVSALINKVSAVSWSQATANRQPAYDTSSGKPAVVYYGSQLIQSTEAAVVNAFKDTNPLTIFFVTKLTSGDAVGYFIGGSKASAAAGFRLYLQNSTGAGVYTFQYFADGGTLQTTSSSSGWVTTSRNVLEFRDTGGQFAMEVNGVPAIALTTYTGGVSGKTIVTIGAFDNNGAPASFLNGSVHEILVYNRILTNAERSQVRQYLGLKWSVAVTP